MFPQEVRLKRPADFFSTPEKCSVIEDLKKEFQEGNSVLLDEALLREQKDWSLLADRVVGAEESYRS